MNFMDIKTLDIANGPGCRISLFVSGCRHHCPGCFNPESWDFKAGMKYTNDTQKRIIDLMGADHITGLSILGGEPFESENILPVTQLVLNSIMIHPEKTIWIYTGFRFEDLYFGSPMAKQLIDSISVLVDGRFEEDKKDIRLQYCGSTNQRVINIPATLAHKRIATHDLYDYKKDIQFGEPLKK